MEVARLILHGGQVVALTQVRSCTVHLAGFEIRGGPNGREGLPMF